MNYWIITAHWSFHQPFGFCCVLFGVSLPLICSLHIWPFSCAGNCSLCSLLSLPCLFHLCRTHHFSFFLLSSLFCSPFPVSSVSLSSSLSPFLSLSPSSCLSPLSLFLHLSLCLMHSMPRSPRLSVVVCMSWLWLLWILSCNRQCTVLVSDVCVTCFLPDPISSSQPASLPACLLAFSGLVPFKSSSSHSLHPAASWCHGGK